jgi:N-acylglucosamine-6-phosphate 2-epimerase
VEDGRVSALDAFRGGLVVSVQAPPGSPLRDPAHMAAIARAAEEGGAAGIRAAGAQDVAAIKAAVHIPVIGLHKRHAPEGVLITPTLEDARRVADAGADVVAVDATLRPRTDGGSTADFLAELGEALAVPVLADVDELEAGRQAEAAGAAAVATTLAGYTGAAVPVAPDLELVAALDRAVDVPVVAEGRYATPAQVRDAFAAGADAVVVGTAITDPMALTRRLAVATPAGAQAR